MTVNQQRPYLLYFSGLKIIKIFTSKALLYYNEKLIVFYCKNKLPAYWKPEERILNCVVKN